MMIGSVYGPSAGDRGDHRDGASAVTWTATVTT